MGPWGVGILQNDTTADVWAEFKQLYHLGNSPKEIRKKLEEDYKPEEDEEEYAEIWTGIAHGQWMCGDLEDYTLAKVQKCIDEKKGMILWEESTEDYEKRLRVIKDFIEKIQVPRDKSLKRKRIVPRPAYFQEGDVISIKLDDHSFAYALVYVAEEDEMDGSNNLIFLEKVNGREKSLEEVLDLNVMYLDIGGRNKYYQGYFWGTFGARNMSRKIKVANKIGNVKVDDILALAIGLPIGDWNAIGSLYQEQEDFLKVNESKMPYKIPLKRVLEPVDTKLKNYLINHDKKLYSDRLNQTKG